MLLMVSKRQQKYQFAKVSLYFTFYLYLNSGIDKHNEQLYILYVFHLNEADILNWK